MESFSKTVSLKLILVVGVDKVKGRYPRLKDQHGVKTRSGKDMGNFRELEVGKCKMWEAV